MASSTLALGDVGDQLLDLELADIGQLEFRHQIDLHREFEVGLAVRPPAAMSLTSSTRGGKAGFSALSVTAFWLELVDRRFDDLAHHRLAEGLLQEGDRRLAGAEALQVDARLHLLELAGQALVEVLGADHDLVFAAQVFGDGLGNLHWAFLLRIHLYGWPAGFNPATCPSPPFGLRHNSLLPLRGRSLVRAEGLEPPRLSSLEPKSSASTSSATPASGPARPSPYAKVAPEGRPYIRAFRAGLECRRPGRPEKQRHDDRPGSPGRVIDPQP